jgi:membrane-associated protease RseP (regulator of RpoE activity)
VYDPAMLPHGTVDVALGKNLIYSFLESVFADPERVPNVHEIMHYPFLFAGFLSLIFTCINLLPIGQLDGGHVLYGLLGYKWHKRIATAIFVAFIFYAGLGLVHPHEPIDDLMYEIPFYLLALFLMFRTLASSTRDRVLYALAMFTAQYLVTWIFPTVHGYSGWLAFAFVIGTFIGVQHPVSEIEEPLDLKRKILGWLALLIFILCFTPEPIIMVEATKATP